MPDVLAKSSSNDGGMEQLRLAAIVNSTDDAIVGKTLEGMVTSWNPGAERMFGYTAQEMIGQPILRIFPPDRRHEEAEFLARISRGERIRNFQTQRVRKDGVRIDISVTLSPIVAADGSVVGVSKIAQDISEQKRAEAAARQGELRFRTLADSMPQLAWIADSAGNIRWYNQRFYEYTGAQRGEMEGWDWSSLHDPARLADVTQRWTEAITSGEPFEMEIPLRGKDGRFRLFLARAQPFRDPQGRVVEWFGTNTDVDQLKRAEERLRRSEASLAAAQARAKIGSWELDCATGAITWSDEMYRLFGRERAAGPPTTAEVVLRVHPADREAFEAQHRLTLVEHKPHALDFRIVRPDAAVRWLAGRAELEFGADGQPVRVVGTAQDITERKWADDVIKALNASLEQRVAERTAELEAANGELKRSRAELKTLLETLPGLYLVLLPDYTIAAVSDAYNRATLTTRAGIVGRGLFEVFPDSADNAGADGAGKLRASLDRVRATGATDTMPIQRYDLRRPDGTFEPRFWSPVNSPMFAPDGSLKYIIHRVEDVTEFMRRGGAEKAPETLQARLQQMEAEVFASTQRIRAANVKLEAANAELEAFSYSVSHDLRAPIRAIDGFAQALVEDYGEVLPDEARKYIATIRGGARRMGMLIDDLLTFSRLSRLPVSRQPVAMVALVRSTLDELAASFAERQVKIEVHELPEVLGDRNLLRQVWLNLLGNALKYTQKRAVATIEVGCRPVDGVDTFYVRDNGIGFDMRYVGKLFGVFQRLHANEEFEGTGVGLAIVRRIVQRHGGKIWAEGHVDQGAEFLFTLPDTPTE